MADESDRPSSVSPSSSRRRGVGGLFAAVGGLTACNPVAVDGLIGWDAAAVLDRTSPSVNCPVAVGRFAVWGSVAVG